MWLASGSATGSDLHRQVNIITFFLSASCSCKTIQQVLGTAYNKCVGFNNLAACSKQVAKELGTHSPSTPLERIFLKWIAGMKFASCDNLCVFAMYVHAHVYSAFSQDFKKGQTPSQKPIPHYPSTVFAFLMRSSRVPQQSPRVCTWRSPALAHCQRSPWRPTRLNKTKGHKRYSLK